MSPQQPQQFSLTINKPTCHDLAWDVILINIHHFYWLNTTEEQWMSRCCCSARKTVAQLIQEEVSFKRWPLQGIMRIRVPWISWTDVYYVQSYIFLLFWCDRVIFPSITVLLYVNETNLSARVTFCKKRGIPPGGGQANICGAYAENLFRASFGTHLQIFSKIADFFINFFGTHQIFSENANFFHWKFGTHLFFSINGNFFYGKFGTHPYSYPKESFRCTLVQRGSNYFLCQYVGESIRAGPASGWYINVEFM